MHYECDQKIKCCFVKTSINNLDYVVIINNYVVKYTT